MRIYIVNASIKDSVKLVRVLVDSAVTFQEVKRLTILCFKAALYAIDMPF